MTVEAAELRDLQYRGGLGRHVRSDISRSLRQCGLHRFAGPFRDMT